MFLDEAHARSIQGPATMDGIGPTRGWETFWMEVDVKRRRGAPWAAPVPRKIIAGKVHHRHRGQSRCACELATRRDSANPGLARGAGSIEGVTR